MKIFLYFVLIIAFLIFYQREPIIAGVFFVIFVVAFLYFKIRKSKGKGMGSSRFLHKGLDQTNENNDNLMFFFMMQQLSKNGNNARYNTDFETSDNEKWNEKQEYINATKEKILAMLDIKS